MAMLKICSFSHTTWIADVSRLDEVRGFTVKEGESPWDACFGGSPPSNPCAYMVDFGETQKDGKLVRVYTKPAIGPGSDYCQLWVVPADSCYLMEGGKTVDRL